MEHDFIAKALRLVVEELKKRAPLSQMNLPRDLKDFLGGGWDGDRDAGDIISTRPIYGLSVKKLFKILRLRVGLTIQFPDGEVLTFFPPVEEAEVPQAKEKFDVQGSSGSHPGYENLPFSL